MVFYIYHRPLLSVRRKDFLGTLIHVAAVEKEYSPDGEVWKRKRCVRSEKVHNRLITMLKNGGMEEDNIYPLTEGRSVKDLVGYINLWEKK